MVSDLESQRKDEFSAGVPRFGNRCFAFRKFVRKSDQGMTPGKLIPP
jgi:hypothetical protein